MSDMVVNGDTAIYNHKAYFYAIGGLTASAD